MEKRRKGRKEDEKVKKRKRKKGKEYFFVRTKEGMRKQKTTPLSLF